MSIEFTPRDHAFPIEDCSNCLAISIATASRFFNPNHFLDGAELTRIMPYQSDYYLTNLFALLAESGTAVMTHEIIEIPAKRTVFFGVVKQALLGGALVEVGVKGTPWVRRSLSETDPDPDNSNHSLLVYGFYQPNDRRPTGYFYLVDPWGEQKRFISHEDVFAVRMSKNKLTLNLFNLSFDPTGLVAKFGIKNSQLSLKARTEIIELCQTNGQRISIASPKLKKR